MAGERSKSRQTGGEKAGAFAECMTAAFPDAACRLLPGEPMSDHSTFRVGGAADIAFSPASEEEVSLAVRTASQLGLPLTVIGNGSNILVSDRGIRGAVLLMGRDFADIRSCGDGTVAARAGALLSSLAKTAARLGLSGLEFAGGIPGSVGGAVYMNAGAYEHCLSEVVCRSRGCDPRTGELFDRMDTASHDFGYRASCYSRSGAIVLEARFSLRPGSREDIESRMAEYAGRRRDTQPLELPSAGSTFKRPEGHFAGRLIEDAGLKGFRIGGASVSTKHAGFIVNDRNATADDVMALIRHVRGCVMEKYGVMLEPEIRILGEW